MVGNQPGKLNNRKGRRCKPQKARSEQYNGYGNEINLPQNETKLSVTRE
jgi:hypothetical protein